MPWPGHLRSQPRLCARAALSVCLHVAWPPPCARACMRRSVRSPVLPVLLGRCCTWHACTLMGLLAVRGGSRTGTTVPACVHIPGREAALVWRGRTWPAPDAWRGRRAAGAGMRPQSARATWGQSEGAQGYRVSDVCVCVRVCFGGGARQKAKDSMDSRACKALMAALKGRPSQHVQGRPSRHVQGRPSNQHVQGRPWGMHKASRSPLAGHVAQAAH